MNKIIAVVVWSALCAIIYYCLKPRRAENLMPDNYQIPASNIARRARYEYKKIVLNKLPEAKFQLEDFE